MGLPVVTAISRILANPAVLAVLGAATLGLLAWVGRDFSWDGRQRREFRRSDRAERKRAGRPLGGWR